GSRTDVGVAALDGDATASIEADLGSGMRHVVPVDGKARARDIGAARDADALPAPDLPAPLGEVRPSLKRIEALAQAHRGDPELVDGPAVGWLEDPLAVFERIEAEIFGDLVDLALAAVARLRRDVPQTETGLP